MTTEDRDQIICKSENQEVWTTQSQQPVTRLVTYTVNSQSFPDCKADHADPTPGIKRSPAQGSKSKGRPTLWKGRCAHSALEWTQKPWVKYSVNILELFGANYSSPCIDSLTWEASPAQEQRSNGRQLCYLCKHVSSLMDIWMWGTVVVYPSRKVWNIPSRVTGLCMKTALE